MPTLTEMNIFNSRHYVCDAVVVILMNSSSQAASEILCHFSVIALIFSV